MESDIPFPLLAGQWASVMQNSTKQYVKISGQPKYFDLTYDYEIGPDLQIADQTLTLGTGSGAISAFRTDYLKEWVTWIDNKYLTVSWVLDDINVNSLSSFQFPQDELMTPYGTVNFPLFIYDNRSGNVTFTLKNASLSKTIRGTLHIMMYDYYTEKPVATAPPQYTETTYGGRKS